MILEGKMNINSMEVTISSLSVCVCAEEEIKKLPSPSPWNRAKIKLKNEIFF